MVIDGYLLLFNAIPSYEKRILPEYIHSLTHNNYQTNTSKSGLVAIVCLINQSLVHNMTHNA